MKVVWLILIVAFQSLAIESKILELHQISDGNLEIPYPAFQSEDEWDVMAKLFEPQTKLAAVWAKRFLKLGVTKNASFIEKRQGLIVALNNRFEESSQLRALIRGFASYEADMVSSFDANSDLNGTNIQMLYYHDEQLLGELAPAAVTQSIFANMNWQMAFYKLLIQYTGIPLVLITSYHQAKWVLNTGSSGLGKYFYALWTPMQLWGILSNPLGIHFELQKSYQTLSESISNLGKAIHLLLLMDATGTWLPADLTINLSEVDRNNFEYFLQMTEDVSSTHNHLFQFSLAKALAAFRVYMELRKPLAKYLERLAKLDFYLSVAASVYHNPEDFSFVRFTSDEGKTLIEAKNLWNPLLNKARAVKNNLSIDAQMMLTGPNASGKSTLMKAVAMNAHLAQTIGIVTASEFTVQPLGYIHSLVTHHDKTAELSSYQMELKNIKHILQTLPEGPGLMIMDEPFRSTNPREAEIASRRVLNHLCKFKNLGLMVSTHLSALTEGESSCNRVNKHMQNYELQDGAFTGSNALEILTDQLRGVLYN